MPETRYTYRDSDDKVIAAETGTIPDPSSWVLTVAARVDTSFDSRRYPVRVATSSGGTTFNVNSASFDDRGQQICTTVRMNPAIFASLPADACTLGSQGSAGPDRILRNSYDTAGQLLQVQKAYGTALQQSYVTYTYSANGKQTSVKDANGNRATLTYDGFDQLSKWTFPSKTTPGQVNTADYESYTYDAAGNRTSLRKRDGATIVYQYDGLNRPIVKTVPVSASGAAGYSVYSGYDVRGLPLYARFGSASGQGVSNTYDGFGRSITSTTTMGGTSRTLSYQYNEAGSKTRLTHPDGAYFLSTYDAAERLTGTGWCADAQGCPDLIANYVTFNYDSLGRPQTIARGWWSSQQYAYDGISRLTWMGSNFAAGADGMTDTLGYNPASQIVSKQRSNDAYVWTGGVSVTRNYAVNGLNQYTTAGPATFDYDINGNLRSDGSNAYVYDAENRLVSASASGGTTLAYDPLGRLWQTSSASFGVTRFVYDGDHVAVEYDSAGGVRRRFGWGVGVDEPLFQNEGGPLSCAGTWLFHTDHQGSTIAAIDCWGNRRVVNTYDEYGIPGAGNWGRYQYTGQAWIPDLGVYYYKARMYSPTLGRFLQTDPIGYNDQINLYAYVANDPVNGTDPTGTSCEREGGGLCGFARDFFVGDIEDAVANPSATSIAIAVVTTVFKPAKVLDKAVDSVQALRKVEKAADKLSPLKPSTPIGTRVRTPDNSPGNFTRLKGGQGFKDNKTGTVFRRSNTNHSQSANGEFKAGAKPGEPPTKGNKDTVAGGQDGGCLLKRDRC